MKNNLLNGIGVSCYIGESEKLRKNSKEFLLLALSNDPKDKLSQLIGIFRNLDTTKAKLFNNWINLTLVM